LVRMVSAVLMDSLTTLFPDVSASMGISIFGQSSPIVVLCVHSAHGLMSNTIRRRGIRRFSCKDASRMNRYKDPSCIRKSTGSTGSTFTALIGYLTAYLPMLAILENVAALADRTPAVDGEGVTSNCDEAAGMLQAFFEHALIHSLAVYWGIIWKMCCSPVQGLFEHDFIKDLVIHFWTVSVNTHIINFPTVMRVFCRFVLDMPTSYHCQTGCCSIGIDYCHRLLSALSECFFGIISEMWSLWSGGWFIFGEPTKATWSLGCVVFTWIWNIERSLLKFVAHVGMYEKET
jgi:hypothetical protein